MVETGAVLHGKYRIEQVLGKGGMGVVARARHVDLDKLVALKLLRPEVLQNQNAVERFRRESRAMVQLKSQHVCQVFDVGTLDSGVPYMVMEYLEGKDLGHILREQTRLEPGFAVDLVLQACEALAEAHALGIVHRDVKPANCFLTCGPGGEPLLKVLDFGIAKAVGAVDDGITTSQSVIGSPSYMSPEQMRSSKHVDARTDVWALGVVLYELVSGRRPFESDSFAGMCLAVTTTPMRPLDDVAGLPEGLAAVIARCLEKQPDARFGSVAALSAALAPYAGTSFQGERSSARTARMLERISAPARPLPGTSTTVAAGPRRSGAEQRAAPAPGMEPAPEPTVTATAHERPRPTGPARRAAPDRTRPERSRRRGLLITTSLTLCALALALEMVRGAGNEPGQVSGGDGVPVGAALPAASAGTPGIAAATPDIAPEGRGQAGAGVEGAGQRGADAEPVPAAAGEVSPAAPAQGQTASAGQADREAAAHSARPGLARRGRRGGVQSGAGRRSADARPVPAHEAPAPARADTPAPAQASEEPWLDDAAFIVRQ